MTTPAAERLSAHGLRPTPQRLAVYEYLCGVHSHPTADTVYQALTPRYPTFSKTTIYNSLYALSKAGLIATLTIDGDELRFDGNPQEHGHFCCTCCRAVTDFSLSRLSLAALCPTDYEFSRGDMFLYGLCPQCRENGSKK